MTQADVSVDGLARALGLGFSLADMLDDNAATLTTEHPMASRGLPVLVKDGNAYGPADLDSVVLHLSSTSLDTVALIAPAQAAGWTVKVLAWCDHCGNELSNPETRQPGDRHEACR